MAMGNSGAECFGRMNSGNAMTIQPARNVSGAVRLPGDKSISHRYAMLAALAEGASRFENFSTGGDCASTLRCLGALGCGVAQRDGVLEIAGRGKRLEVPPEGLDCGNSGSTMRMLAGILAGQEFCCEMRGDESLSRRPMQRIITPLEQMGAGIDAQAGGLPPLRITGVGGSLRAIEYKMPVASAQVKSCVLFAGLLAKGETRIEEPARTRDHGELALRAFGAEVERRGTQVQIRGGQPLSPISATIPGDISSAAFFLSIEFQQTGYLVERIYKAAYGDASGASTFNGSHQLAVPIVRFGEFLPDTQAIGSGVVVGATGWETVLENNKQAFTNGFVQRSRFTSAYATSLMPAQLVDKLFTNAGVTPSTTDRNAAIAEFGSATNTSDVGARGRALRRVAENATLNTQEFNRAFVLMQFFGYLRRNPNDAPDSDYTGYDFWLTKLNQFNGNFQNAEMVKAFITSGEYRQRFGPS